MAAIQPVSAATPPPSTAQSALGNEAVLSIAVSPAYARTGLVLATTAAMGGCQNACVHLWRSRDGGASWALLHPTGWQQGAMLIVPSGGGDVVYADAGSHLLASTDAGSTWAVVGAPGAPARAENSRIAVAAANGEDYTLSPSGTQPVTGSGGSDADLAFAVSPSFPGGGARSPALLAALDVQAKSLLVLHCDAALACGSPAVVAQGSDVQPGTPVELLPADDFPTSGAVFVATQHTLYKSTDGATTFTELNVASPAGAAAASIPMVVLAPGYREQGPVRTAYAAVLQVIGPATPQPVTRSSTRGGIYRTTDGGTTWRPLAHPGPFDNGASAVAVAADGRLFAGYFGSNGQAGLVCSVDGGTSWRSSCPAVGDAVHAVPATPRGGCPASGCAVPPSPGAQATAGASGSAVTGAPRPSPPVVRSREAVSGLAHPAPVLAISALASVAAVAVVVLRVRRLGVRKRRRR